MVQLEQSPGDGGGTQGRLSFFPRQQEEGDRS